MTSTSDSLDTVLRFHRAWTSGDVDQAMTFVADDVVCRAPGTDLIGKEAYRDYLDSFVPQLTGVSEEVSLADENRVALLYYPYTAVTRTAPATESFTLRDGVITENVIVFDRLAFTPPSQP